MANKGKDYGKKERLDHGDKDSKDGKYPYIQVKESEAGHIYIIDDTPDKARLFWAHESGSYVEMTTQGKVKRLCVGDCQDYNKAGVTFTVDENNDIKIHGHQRIVIGGGSYLEVAGDADIGVAGNTTMFTKGNFNMHCDNFYCGAKQNVKFNAGGDMLMETKGNMESKVGNNQVNEVKGDQENKVEGSMKDDIQEGHTKNTREYNIRANVTLEGDLNQTGVHTDSLGNHLP